MKPVQLAFVVAGITMAVACNNNKEKEGAADTSAPTESTSSPQTSTPTNQPKSYKVVFSPDSLILGKSSEALVKVMGSTAVALSDPDGKDNGMEFIVKLQVTNKQKIGEGSSLSISYADARLQLDNGTSISTKTGTDYLRAQPEASGNTESWTFEVPAGAKPTALNLFMNGTRASINVTVE